MTDNIQDIKNVPELRFPEFEGEWVCKKFSSLYSFKPTNSFSREKLNYEEGCVKNIHYGDIHTKFKTFFDVSEEHVPFVNEDVNLSRISEDCYVQEGDLIIADASEDYADIGKTIEVLKLSGEKVLAGLHTLLARRESNEMAFGFSGALMKTPKVRLDFKQIAQGTKVLGISNKRVADIILNTPNLPEQEKIANFLMQVDKRIENLNKKKEKLEEYKKGVMQKIFSQEIRFKDENGNDYPSWEEKRLGDVVLKKSSSISANSITCIEGDYKIYGATGILQYVDFFNEKEAYISIIKDGAGVGRIMLCEPYSSVLGTLEMLKSKNNNVLIYIYYLLLTVKFEKYITGSTIPHIYFKDYSKEKVLIPKFSEQQKISNFLSSIDTQIEKVTKQIESSKEFKKGLLQKMFV